MSAMMSSPLLDAGMVFSVLETACYSDAMAQQAAMKSLQDMESIDEFVSSLTRILDSDQVPDSKSHCRLLAVINLKNVVSRCWKSRGSTVHLLKADEKVLLKHFLLQRSMYKEKDSRVLTQLSVLMAQVAKADWPQDWPELLPALFTEVSSDDNQPAFSSFRKNDIMTFFYSTAQELGAKTMANARNNLKESLVYMFPYFSKKWSFFSFQLLNILSQCFSADKNANFNFIMEANNLASELSVLTDIMEIILSKTFTSISSAGNFSEFFHFFAAQQSKYLQFLQSLSRETIELFTWASEKYGFNYGECSSSSESADIEKILSSIQNENGDIIAGNTVVLLLRVSSITSKVCNIPINMQKENPLHMVPYLESFLRLYSSDLTMTFQPASGPSFLTDPLFKTILKLSNSPCISSTMFLSNTLSCTFYVKEVSNVSKMKEMLSLRLLAGPGTSSEANNSQVENNIENAASIACDIKSRFFHPDRIHELLQLLLNNSLLLSATQLKEWSDDAELFYIAQEGYKESDTIKTASEGLYLGLLDTAPLLVGTAVAAYLNDLQRQFAAISSSVHQLSFPAERSQEIGFWSSVYLCAGLGPAVLGQYINISEWVTRAAGPLISQLLSHPRAGSIDPLNGDHPVGPQIMKARLLWLLGIFSYQIEAVVLGQIVPVLLSVLESPDSDIVVVMTTVSALGVILAVDGFVSSKILSSADIVRIVGVLCVLTTKRLEEDETRESVISIIKDLFNAHGSGVLRDLVLFSALTRHLSSLWEGSDENSPLKATIIETLTSVVILSGPLSPALHSTCIPLIVCATSGEQRSSHLVNDGVRLWLHIIKNLPLSASPGATSLQYTSEFNDLLRGSLVALVTCGLLGDDDDSLEEVMLVMEAHAIAAGFFCLSSCADVLQLTFSRTIGQVVPRAVPQLMRPLEAFFLTCPQETALFLSQSGLLTTILLPCCAAVPEINQTKILESFEEADVAIISYLSIFARIILCVPHILMDSLNALIINSELCKIFNLSPQSSVVEATAAQQSVLRLLIRLMVDKFDCVGYCTSAAWRRKLWALSLLSLYPQEDPVILGWFPEIVSIVQDVLCEEETALLEGEGRDVDDDLDTVSNGYSTAYKNFLSSDLVTRSILRTVTGEKIAAVKELIGEAAFNQGMMGTLGRTF